ncbi:MAG: hypothetical protein ACM3ZE_04890 [Myxococcales bacterium]
MKPVSTSSVATLACLFAVGCSSTEQSSAGTVTSHEDGSGGSVSTAAGGAPSSSTQSDGGSSVRGDKSGANAATTPSAGGTAAENATDRGGNRASGTTGGNSSTTRGSGSGAKQSTEIDVGTGGVRATSGQTASGGAPLEVTGGSRNAGGSTSPSGRSRGGSSSFGTTNALAGGTTARTESSAENPPGKTSGCGNDPPSADTSIEVNGATACYVLSLPQDYDKNRAYPLFFSFHGAGVPPETFLTYFNMPSVVGADAIVVTPTALGDASMWDEKRDLPLFDALLDKLKSQLCIDTARVFAGGHSSGGMFTSALGCRRGNVLRGIAVLSATPPSGTCTGEVAVWISHGTADTAVKIENGRKNRDFWTAKNGCDASASTPVSPSPTVEYGGCDEGFPVRYCEYDGDHYLPSYAPRGIWDFFKAL